MLVAVVTLSAVLALASLPAEAEAHPGVLDADGCHRMRKSGRKVCHIRPGEHRRYVGLDGAVRHLNRRGRGR